jgi:predicted RNA-binding Zn-ribbon protein involved in translation (DUF1610 family)
MLHFLQTILTTSYNGIAIILAQVDPMRVAEKLAQKHQDQFTTKMILKIGIPIMLGIIYLIINHMTKGKKMKNGENISENRRLCPRCGEEILDSSKKCRCCREDLDKNETKPTPADLPSTPPVHTVNMSVTNQNEQSNNNKNEENIETTSGVKQCPYCGEEVLAAAKKCKHCKEWLKN